MSGENAFETPGETPVAQPSVVPADSAGYADGPESFLAASAAQETAAEYVSGERALEEESEIAADYLEELLDITDLDGDIEIEVHQNRTYLSVVAEEGSEDLEVLVGAQGEVLDSLQELVRLSVLAATGHRSRLILDIGGFRARRNEQLKALALEAVEKVRTSGEPEHLEPMSPYERKRVHDVLAEQGMGSESEGEGRNRHIVVRPAEEGQA